MTVLDDVAAERARQVGAEGWSSSHDDTHVKCEMAIAAACYATAPSMVRIEREWTPPDTPKNWPWHFSWWKPGLYRRNLIKAAALLIAEIERWDRLTGRTTCPNCHDANRYGDYEGPTCQVCMGDGFICRSPALSNGEL